MFEKITEIFTKKIVEEVSSNVEKKTPIILEILVVGVSLFMFLKPDKTKIIPTSMTIINNYYIYNGGNKL